MFAYIIGPVEKGFLHRSTTPIKIRDAANLCINGIDVMQAIIEGSDRIKHTSICFVTELYLNLIINSVYT